jgi:hypothetical protein
MFWSRSQSFRSLDHLRDHHCCEALSPPQEAVDDGVPGRAQAVHRGHLGPGGDLDPAVAVSEHPFPPRGHHPRDLHGEPKLLIREGRCQNLGEQLGPLVSGPAIAIGPEFRPNRRLF